MKKAALFSTLILLAAGVFAEPADSEAVAAETSPASAPAVFDSRAEKASWPVWIAFNDTDNLDVIGLHLNFPGGQAEGVTGFEVGLLGRLRYLEGFQLNLLRNDVSDSAAGIQVGIWNSAGSGLLTGIQVGLWNEAHSFQGIQAGLINLSENATGIQVGLINRTSSIHGFQVGGVNIIRESDLVFLPLVNIGVGE